jgi:CBS domain-containing protein
LISAQTGSPLEACMALMAIHHILSLPVVARENPIGIFSSRGVERSNSASG